MRTFFLVILASFSLFSFSVSVSASDGFNVRITGTVVWVADGDTFRFSADEPGHFESLRAAAESADAKVGRDLRVAQRFYPSNNSFLIRVANIDTPESVHPDGSRNTQAGRDAGEYVKGLLQDVRGTVECYEIGYWGRPICSLWTDDLELGTHLIEKGYADYETGFGRHPTMDAEYRRAMKR